MCKQKFESTTSEPKPGYLAHVLVGHNHHIRTVVQEVAEGGGWARIKNIDNEYHVVIDVHQPDTGDGNGPFTSWVTAAEGGPRYKVTFVRVPEPGDFAQYQDAYLDTVTTTVKAVGCEGAIVTFINGSWAALAEWGAYYQEAGSRGVKFTPYPESTVQEIQKLLKPTHAPMIVAEAKMDAATYARLAEAHQSVKENALKAQRLDETHAWLMSLYLVAVAMEDVQMKNRIAKVLFFVETGHDPYDHQNHTEFHSFHGALAVKTDGMVPPEV